MKPWKTLLILCFLFLLAGCQNTETRRKSGGAPETLSGTEWYSGNWEYFYKFLDAERYNFCYMNPGVVQDEGTYTFIDGQVVFQSQRLRKTTTAAIDGDRLILDTGEIFTRQ